MPTEQRDIVINQGATFEATYHVDDVSHGVGFTVAAKFRGQHASTAAVLSLTGSPQITWTSHGNHGDAVIALTPTTTAALAAPFTGVYDVELTETVSGYIRRVAEGTFYVTPEATR
jgi:hypothetical protein